MPTPAHHYLTGELQSASSPWGLHQQPPGVPHSLSCPCLPTGNSSDSSEPGREEGTQGTTQLSRSGS